MNERELLAGALGDLLDAECGPDVLRASDGGAWAATLWSALEQAGMTRIGIPEESGGSGGTVGDALEVVRIAAGHAAPVPLTETCLMAGWAIARVGERVPDGPLTLAEAPEGEDLMAGVPWASRAALLVVARTSTPPRLEAYPCADLETSGHRNLANEPRDDVDLSGAQPGWSAPLPEDALAELRLRTTLARAVQTVGALETVLELSLRYAREREQFGRPIQRFQAVQHHLAVIAGEVAAGRASAERAVRALANPETDPATSEILVAVAKLRSARAAGEVARLAHQIHGAIGFTDEHVLHHFTRRLLAWRDEDGAEHSWAAKVGAFAVEGGHEGVWGLDA